MIVLSPHPPLRPARWVEHGSNSMTDRLHQFQELLRDAMNRNDEELLAIVLHDLAIEFPQYETITEENCRQPIWVPVRRASRNQPTTAA